jgi:hypothetical protein
MIRPVQNPGITNRIIEKLPIIKELARQVLIKKV